MARASRCALALIAALVAAHCCAAQARTLLSPCSGKIPVGAAYGGEAGLGDYTATCHDAANSKCTPCGLWSKAKEGGNDICKQSSWQQSNCAKGFWANTALALPTTPIRGIEDMVSGSHLIKPAEIWQQVWDLAIKDKLFKDADGALVINSANYRSEHQMHIHIGKMERKFFLPTCVNKVKPGPTFAAAAELSCDVLWWKNTGCHNDPSKGCFNGWEMSGGKPAKVKAIEVSDLTNVWKAYVAGGAASYPGGGDAYHTGLAVMRSPSNAGKWLVVAFSSRTDHGKGAVGDYELLFEH